VGNTQRTVMSTANPGFKEAWRTAGMVWMKTRSLVGTASGPPTFLAYTVLSLGSTGGTHDCKHQQEQR
jgi:hypothetical protein